MLLLQLCVQATQPIVVLQGSLISPLSGYAETSAIAVTHPSLRVRGEAASAGVGAVAEVGAVSRLLLRAQQVLLSQQ